VGFDPNRTKSTLLEPTPTRRFPESRIAKSIKFGDNEATPTSILKGNAMPTITPNEFVNKWKRE
jgi:hypothetical protein